MLAATSQLLPLIGKFARQIVPPVVATLIAAVLIAAYNNLFSGHLQQPRMAALHAAEAQRAAAPAEAVTAKLPAGPVTETITIYEEVIGPERLAEKDASQESGKDQTVKLAEAEPAPAAAALRAAAQTPRVEPKAEARPAQRQETRIEQRQVAAVELPPSAPQTHYQHTYPQPQVQAPYVPQPQPPYYQQQMPYAHAPQAYPQPQTQPPYAAPVAQQPPAVVMATPQVVTAPDRMVTVPDRPAVRRAEVQPVEAQPAENPPPGMLGRIVNTLKPSSLLSRAKEFGDRIEQAGNDILPNIRPQ